MKFKLLVLFTALTALTACEKEQAAPAPAPAQEETTSLETDGDRFSYALGMIIGERILKQYGEVDYELLQQGIQAQHKDQETLLSLEEAGARADPALLPTAIEEVLRFQSSNQLGNRRVVEAVRALPRRQRDCVALRYLMELSVAETAATLRLWENSVKTHLKRGLARLRADLGVGAAPAEGSGG